MEGFKRLSGKDKIESKFAKVKVKKEDGTLYLTENCLIWISEKIDGQPFENISSITDCYYKFSSSNLECFDSALSNLFIIEFWEDLYAQRKRDDKYLVGLRFEKKNVNNDSKFTDINLTLTLGDDFNKFLSLLTEFHNKAIEKIKTIKSEKEVQSTTKVPKNENIIKECDRKDSKLNKRIIIEKKVKHFEKKTIYDNLKQLLKYKPELEQVYKNLVLTGNMSLESFMQMHRQDILISDSQEKGVSNSDFFLKKPPRFNTTNSGGIDVTITAEDLKSILEEMPSIKEKIKEYVPHRLTEEEFWNIIIQSPLFFDLLGQKNTQLNNVDTLMIGEIPKGEELLYGLNKNINNSGLNTLLDSYVDSDINLLNNDTFYKPGYGTLLNNQLNIASDISTSVNSGFFERFNCHGAKILELTTGSEYKYSKYVEIDSQNPQDYPKNESSCNLKNNFQNLHINPVNFFASTRNRENDKDFGIQDNNQSQVVFNSKGNNKSESLFNNQTSRNVLLNCTKQIQYEQINQLNYLNKGNVIQEKNQENEIGNQILFETRVDPEKNELKNQEKPIWMQQIQQEHIQVIELLKYFWGLSLSQKDTEERRKTIESLTKITHNIESLVHDNKNISASSLSTFGQSSNTIRSICLPILETIKSARYFHMKLEEIINSLTNHK
ncbi:general transcription factor IIH subunit 1 [Cryptosporidium felis]|nr:general transcription factor IIH subunit 1 [Cryptosporidium felis]